MSAWWLVSSRVYANATMNGKRAIRSPTASVSQNEIAGFVRYTNQTSGSVTRGRPFGVSSRNIHEKCVGPRAWLHGPLAASGTIVRYALRMFGFGDQRALSVGLSGYSMKPSGPVTTLSTRAGTCRLSRTVVPSVPPGTSSPPTSAASIVRAQTHSKPPQPLLTVLPRLTATGR